MLAVPVFYVLHGVNENYGLIHDSTILRLLVYYLPVSILIGFLSHLLIKEYNRSVVLAFFLLSLFFFFGVFKDLIGRTTLPQVLTSYKVVLILIAISIPIAAYIIKTTRHSLKTTSKFLSTLLIIWLIVETGMLINNSVTGKNIRQDFGDYDHSLIKNIPVADSVKKPFIFWIVMDEYSGQTALSKKWNYINPLYDALKERGFFVADSARSSYNYTHYSLASTLDMIYLKGFQNHSVIGFRDIVRGNLSLSENNVVIFLNRNNYNIENYTIYNLKGIATKANEDFRDADRKLIDNQTLPGRIKQDIGWNFKNIFKSERRRKDSIDHSLGIQNTARERNVLLDISLNAAASRKSSAVPSFFMYHFMLSHEPFIYNNDGSLDLTVGYGAYPEKYISSIKFANNKLIGFVDSIKQMYAGKEYVIILQGDHGFKFDEKDPLFDEEGCSILYAVYCSDGDYSKWNRSFNSVNGFRVLFNKYFNTSFSPLENRSYNFLYRQ